MNLATNQRAQRRDRTNVCMCHLDHLLQLPWAYSPFAGLFVLLHSPGTGESKA